MTEYRRRVKVVGTVAEVEGLKRRLIEKEGERADQEELVTQAQKVVERWRQTYNRRTNELAKLDSEIADITRALDVLAPEVDEYGIERAQRERAHDMVR